MSGYGCLQPDPFCVKSRCYASVARGISTATHFRLRTYKEQGHLDLSTVEGNEWPAVRA